MNNDNNTKAIPVVDSTFVTELLGNEGRQIGISVEITTFKNKEYLQLNVNFPNGSVERMWFHQSRLMRRTFKPVGAVQVEESSIDKKEGA